MFKCTDKRVLITGGAGGIGLASAERFLSAVRRAIEKK